MKEFDVVKDMIYDEIESISRNGKLTKDTVCVLGELVDILKDIGSVEMFEENIYVEDSGMYHTPEERGGYSNRMPRRSYYGGNSYRYGGGYSTRNGGYGRIGRGGYSRDDGKEHMVEKLEHLMMEVSDPNDRDAIQRLINQMEDK